MTAVRLALVSICALLLCRTAWTHDSEAGRQKADKACALCHGKGGVSQQPSVPSLAGQRDRYIILALYQFRAGNRPSAQMAQFAASLSDDDIGDLVAYYSGLRPWRPTRKTSVEAASAGPALAQHKNCVPCHGGPGLSGQEHVPRIAGQRIDYLTAQLRLFRAATRGDIDGNMTSAANNASDKDIDMLADYISGLSTP